MLNSFWKNFLESEEKNRDSNPIIFPILKDLTPIELTEDSLTLASDNQGVKIFLQKKVGIIEKMLASHIGHKLKVTLITKEAKKTKKEAPLLGFQPQSEDVFKKAGIAGKYSFDNFAVSSSNQIAYAAAQAVAGAPGTNYNPLFLWGGVGVGKTHLAQSVARHILEHNLEAKVCFSPGDQFTNELIESIKEKTNQRFRRKYRKLDLLIIDDVQFIAGKNTVQEEFFHTFNAIATAGGQVILTSDRPPSEIKNLEDRLRSRFLGGLTVDIQASDFELRSAILLIKAAEKNIGIEIEAAKVIAENITDSRALEGTLLSLYAKILGKQESIDLEVVDQFFNEKTENNVRRVSPQDIIKSVCSYYNIKQSHLKSATRTERIAHPRQVAMFLLRQELKLKLEEVAYHLKRKDHTTVMHAVEKISRQLAKDSFFKAEVDGIINSLSL